MVLSFDQSTLHQDLSFPERNLIGVFRLLLIAHISIYFGFKVKPGRKSKLIMVYKLFYKFSYLKAPFFGRKSLTCLKVTFLVGILIL